MKLRVTAYQFLSRATIRNKRLGTRRSSPKQRPEIVFELVMKVIDKPFETNFAQLPPANPSIGAHQYVDEEIDVFMSRRWPKCLALEGTIILPEHTLNVQLNKKLLTFLRKLLWTPCEAELAEILGPDQCATGIGYRREFFDRQIFDIAGNRRPNSRETYVPTEVGEPIGPGVASLTDVDPFNNINEFVWTQILPFPNRTKLADDISDIRRAVAALRKYYNGYNELKDAERHAANGEVKAAARSAASAADAVLNYYRELWKIAPPPKNLTFDEKIEHVLREANQPSYRSAAHDNLETLLNLYRARNSMHEGDCSFRDRNGNLKKISKISQLHPFIRAVQDFVVWMDARA